MKELVDPLLLRCRVHVNSQFNYETSPVQLRSRVLQSNQIVCWISALCKSSFLVIITSLGVHTLIYLHYYILGLISFAAGDNLEGCVLSNRFILN